METNKVNRMINDCYKFYKSFVGREMNDDDIDECIETAEKIRKLYNCKFADEVLLAVINEIDRIMKQNAEQEKIRLLRE